MLPASSVVKLIHLQEGGSSVAAGFDLGPPIATCHPASPEDPNVTRIDPDAQAWAFQLARAPAGDTLTKMKHSLAREVDEAMSHLDAGTQAHLEALIRDALALAAGKSIRREATDAYGYPLGHFKRTYGSFADEPLERPSQGKLEEREEW